MRTYHIYINNQYVDTVQGKKQELTDQFIADYQIHDKTIIELKACLGGAMGVGQVASSNPFGCKNHTSQRVERDDDDEFERELFP